MRQIWLATGGAWYQTIRLVQAVGCSCSRTACALLESYTSNSQRPNSLHTRNINIKMQLQCWVTCVHFTDHHSEQDLILLQREKKKIDKWIAATGWRRRKRWQRYGINQSIWMPWTDGIKFLFTLRVTNQPINQTNPGYRALENPQKKKSGRHEKNRGYMYTGGGH